MIFYLFSFFVGFMICWWLLRSTVSSLEKRVEWLEDQAAEPEPLTYQARVMHTRYIPIERRTV